MIRKTLTILSLLGLLLSVGLWGVSFYGIRIGRFSRTVMDEVVLGDGILRYIHSHNYHEQQRSPVAGMVVWNGGHANLRNDRHSGWMPRYEINPGNPRGAISPW